MLNQHLPQWYLQFLYRGSYTKATGSSKMASTPSIGWGIAQFLFLFFSFFLSNLCCNADANHPKADFAKFCHTKKNLQIKKNKNWWFFFPKIIEFVTMFLKNVFILQSFSPKKRWQVEEPMNSVKTECFFNRRKITQCELYNSFFLGKRWQK
jgi:hypothetical protein